VITTPTTLKPIKPGVTPGQCGDENDCEVCGNECFESQMLSQLKLSGKTCGTSGKNIACKCESKNCLMTTKTDDELCGVVDFVCGTDDVTYKNKCEADKAGTVIQCTGTCPCDVGVICPTIYQPVCGINGKTYNNPCEAQSKNIPLKCMSACPCATTTTSTTTTLPITSPSTGNGGS